MLQRFDSGIVIRDGKEISVSKMASKGIYAWRYDNGAGAIIVFAKDENDALAEIKKVQRGATNE